MTRLPCAVDAIAHRAGLEREVAGRVRLGQLGDEDARLRPDVAAEGLAIGAIGAGRAALIGLRQDRMRRRERVIAELLGAVLEQDAGLVLGERRQRIFALTRRLERVAAVDLAALQIAGLAGDAEVILDLVVERLEFGIAQRPVGERGVRRDRRQPIAFDGIGAGAEIVLVQAPRHRTVMHGAAAGLIAVVHAAAAGTPAYWRSGAT